jgi:hypothetical protein
MLTIEITELEFYDSAKEMFLYTKPVTVRMEHSLISISKWEAIWEKAYLPTPGVVPGLSGIDEERSYIRCMIIGEVSEHVPAVILQNYGEVVRNYIEKTHSATTIHRRGIQRPNRSVVTSELIYYWMTKFSIPFECERWHFNRLLMLIDVCNVKEASGTKGGKLSTKEAAKYMSDLNKARKGG